MEVKLGVKMEVKVDNTFCDNAFVHFNSLFITPLLTPLNGYKI